MNRVATWPELIGASLMGVCTAWLIYAVASGLETFAFSRPSQDIAMAFYPAAIMIALVIALLLFWPLNILMARLGTSLSISRPWARRWWTWAMAGAVVGALPLVILMGVLSSWAADNMSVLGIGASMGAAAALVTHWRLRVGRTA